MIQLVSPSRSVLHRPQPSCLGMYGSSLEVAMAVRPYLGAGIRPGDEWIVCGDRSVGFYPHDLPDARREILGLTCIVRAVALSHEHRPIPAQNNSRAEVGRADDLRLLPVDDAHVLESSVSESGASHRSSGSASFAGLGVGEVNRVVRCE